MPRGLWVASNRGFHDDMLAAGGIPSPTRPTVRMGPSPAIVSTRSSDDRARRGCRGGVLGRSARPAGGDGFACRQCAFASSQVPFSAARRALSAVTSPLASRSIIGRRTAKSSQTRTQPRLSSAAAGGSTFRAAKRQEQPQTRIKGVGKVSIPNPQPSIPDPRSY